MGISELRQIAPSLAEAEADAGLAADAAPVERALLANGAVSAGDIALARRVGEVCDADIGRILTAEGLIGGEALLDAHARQFGSRRLDAADLARLAPLDTARPPARRVRHGVLAVRARDGRPALVCHDPGARAALLPELPAGLREARLLWAPRVAIQNRIAELHRAALGLAMTTRVAEAESCRSWGRARGPRIVAVLGLIAILGGLCVLWPRLVFAALAGWAVLTLAVAGLYKIAAFIAGLAARGDTDPAPEIDSDARLPKISILVPLFRETEILHALVARLGRLSYPKCLLDVILILEESDSATRRALAGIDLPVWMRAVVVPDGTPRTKPRAMNYALDFCDGDIVGVYDAEDAPDPDQLTRVARRFLTAPPEVVCLQGVLDYYNPRQNWLARCFTIEYAAWFRLMLPGMARLGLAIPLGGTTLFFRRDALEALGGWDSHNVTEDADLGFRLARHGLRTEMLATVTGEEANCRPWPWIRQRSRWLKGYMSTWLVHMRRPRLLRRQLGTWRFLGFQAHFVSALSQVLLAPVLWSFWLVLLGLPHPLDPYLPHGAMVGLGVLFLSVEVVNLTIHASAVSGEGHRHLLAWAPTMHFYAPLAAVAAWKAVYELVLKPFFWDKTRHGLSLGTIETATPGPEPILRRPPQPRSAAAADLA